MWKRKSNELDLGAIRNGVGLVVAAVRAEEKEISRSMTTLSALRVAAERRQLSARETVSAAACTTKTVKSQRARARVKPTNRQSLTIDCNLRVGDGAAHMRC
jgi:hypothetical protein